MKLEERRTVSVILPANNQLVLKIVDPPGAEHVEGPASPTASRANLHSPGICAS